MSKYIACVVIMFFTINSKAAFTPFKIDVDLKKIQEVAEALCPPVKDKSQSRSVRIVVKEPYSEVTCRDGSEFIIINENI